MYHTLVLMILFLRSHTFKLIFCSHSWECLADAYMWRGAHMSALRSYQRASELSPKSVYSLIQLGNIELVSCDLLFLLNPQKTQNFI